MLPVPRVGVLSDLLSVSFSSAERLLWCFVSLGGAGAVTLHWEQCLSAAHGSWESPSGREPGWLAWLRVPLAFILPVL